MPRKLLIKFGLAGLIMTFGFALTPANATITNTVADSGISAQSASNVVVNQSFRRVTIFWAPPADDGGVSISWYQVMIGKESAINEFGSIEGCISNAQVTGSQDCAVAWVDPNWRQIRFNWLTPSTDYRVFVQSINSNNDYSDRDSGFLFQTFADLAVPSAVSVTPSRSAATVSWSAPEMTEASVSTTGYSVEYSDSMDGPFSYHPDFLCVGLPEESATLSCEIPGLTTGQQYWFRVVATDSNVTRHPSEPVAAVIAEGPSAPESVSMTYPAEGEVSVTWAEPLDDGGSPVSGYQIEILDLDSQLPVTVQGSCESLVAPLSSDVRECVLTGLSHTGSYQVSVRAINAAHAGTFAASEPFHAHILPSAVPSVSAVSFSRQLQVSWETPVDDGGTPITDYRVYVLTPTTVPTGTYCVPNELRENEPECKILDVSAAQGNSVTISGLNTSTIYSYFVQPINAIGRNESVTTNESISTRAHVQSASNVQVDLGFRRATVTWDPPLDDGGFPIVGYRVMAGKESSIIEFGSIEGCISNSVVTNSGECSIAAASSDYRQMNFIWFDPSTEYRIYVQSINSNDEYSYVDSGYSFETLADLAVPSAVEVIASQTSAVVSWSVPEAVEADVPITGYSVEYSESADGPFVFLPDFYCVGLPADISPMSCDIQELTTGQHYWFRVVAMDANLVRHPSEPVAAITWTLPGVPTNVSVSGTRGSATVTWDSPLDDGGYPISDYSVLMATSANPDSFTVADCDVNVEERSCTVSGLSYSDRYYFAVEATTAKGDSVASDVVSHVSAATNPTAPRNVVASVQGAGGALVSWSLPLNTGVADSEAEPISSYSVTVIPSDGVTIGAVNVSARTVSVSGLSVGVSYAFKVSATNSEGLASVLSDESTAIVWRTVSAAPRNVVATRGNASAVVRWQAPLSNGGSSVTKYVAQALVKGNPVTGKTCSTPTVTPPAIPAVTCTIAGLTNGTSYAFVVKATNGVGESVASLASSTVVPATVPSAPGSVSVKSVSKGVAQWKITLGSTGGSPITSTKFRTSKDNKKWSAWVSVKTGSTTKGWTKGVKYYIQVQSTNAVGAGATKAITFKPTK